MFGRGRGEGETPTGRTSASHAQEVWFTRLGSYLETIHSARCRFSIKAGDKLFFRPNSEALRIVVLFLSFIFPVVTPSITVCGIIENEKRRGRRGAVSFLRLQERLAVISI